MKRKSAVEHTASRVRDHKPAHIAPPSASSPCLKVTISLFPGDREAIDRLAEMLHRHCGILANRSDAIKIALRIATDAATPEAVKAHYADYKQEDGRKKRKV